MTELKPCPFCGEVPKITGDPDSEEYIVGYTMGFVECRNDSCPDVGNFIIAPTQKEATAIWNARPFEDKLTAHIVKLNTLIDELIAEGTYLSLLNGLVPGDSNWDKLVDRVEVERKP